MPTLLKQTAWLLSGESAPEVAAHVKRAYANGELLPPANGSMAYMLSPEQVLNANGLRGLPHLMLFYDKSQPASAWGADALGSPGGHDSTSDAHAPFLTLFIGVRRWSSGAPAGESSGNTHLLNHSHSVGAEALQSRMSRMPVGVLLKVVRD